MPGNQFHHTMLWACCACSAQFTQKSIFPWELMTKMRYYLPIRLISNFCTVMKRFPVAS
jgi:hypothetical protein